MSSTARPLTASSSSGLMRKFLRAEEGGDDVSLLPGSSVAVSAWDALDLFYRTPERTKGGTDGDDLLAAMKGQSLIIPRGPISIDREQNVTETPATSKKNQQLRRYSLRSGR